MVGLGVLGVTGCSWVLPEPAAFMPLEEEDAMIEDARPPRPDFAIATAFDMRIDMQRPVDMADDPDQATDMGALDAGVDMNEAMDAGAPPADSGMGE